VVQHALTQLPADQADLVRERLACVEKAPPLPDEIDEVLDDFERSLRVTAEAATSLLHAFQEPPDDPSEPIEPRRTEPPRAADAQHTAGVQSVAGSPPVAGTPPGTDSPPSAGTQSPAESQPSETAAPSAPTVAAPTAFEPSDDPIADLQRLSAFQVAGALQEENPRTAAIVLSCLPAAQAAEVLRLIADPLRSQAFMRLSQVVSTPGALVERVVRTIVDRAAALSESPAQESDVEQKMVEMLRAMSKKNRGQMLELVAQEDPDLAERLRQQMFAFQDIVRVESRSLQRLLMEIDMETLLAALRNADPRIIDKIMTNVSKRTRDTLTEEMQYVRPMPEDQLEAARATVTRKMAELDEQGQLVMED
jgi:flagellar motor switch protein FliG